MLICGKPTKHRDQGWSWVVLFTSFTIQLLCDGSISAYGVVYAGVKNDTYFARANYTERQITLPGAIQSCLYVIAMGFAGPIVNTLGFQLVACVSSLMAGLAMVAAVFFKDIAGMIVFYGVFSGMGLGSLYLCACVAVTYYFERYRGAASGIAAAGNGLGYIVVPIIISSLTSYYDTNVGWRNGVLIFGIILSIVTFLCGLTLRPLEIEAPTEEEIQEKEMKECLTSHPEPMLTTHLETIHETGIFEVDKRYRQDIEDFSKGAQLDTSPELFSSVPWISGGLMEGMELSKHNASWENIKRGDPEIYIFGEPGNSKGKHTDHVSIHKSNPDIPKFPRLEPSYMHAKVIRRTRQRRPSIARPMDRPDSLFTSSLHILPDLERSTSSLQLSSCKHLQLREKQTICGEDAAYLSTVSLPGSIDSEIRLDKPPKSSKSFTQRMVDLFDLTLFCNSAFIIFSVSSITLQLAYFVPFVYFYTFVIETGLTKEDALMLITILGILHTFGRLFGGILANIPCVDIVLLTGVSFILCGACHFTLPFLPHNFIALAIYAGAYGFFSAIPCPIFALIVVKYLGLHRLTMAISNSCLLKGLVAAFGPIIAAVIKDSTGNLDGTFYWCGACFALTGIALLLLNLPCVKNEE